MMPFFGAMVAALMVITYVPSVSLWLPVQTKTLKAEEVEEPFFMNPPSVTEGDSVDSASN